MSLPSPCVWKALPGFRCRRVSFLHKVFLLCMNDAQAKPLCAFFVAYFWLRSRKLLLLQLRILQ